ncbi:phox-associated domain,Sorting nexin [Artemisia annua]|uniref:Phox-associated domain,Sorting nexin n=1 Tax=Artemisia annua TaxID=35608 RepID=A0A2U1LZP5_ARTAN|nr:phox-associated domain,Sorting nexin [Artemisia annua]
MLDEENIRGSFRKSNSESDLINPALIGNAYPDQVSGSIISEFYSANADRNDGHNVNVASDKVLRIEGYSPKLKCQAFGGIIWLNCFINLRLVVFVARWSSTETLWSRCGNVWLDLDLILRRCERGRKKVKGGSILCLKGGFGLGVIGLGNYKRGL